ncbi:hypothetical protein D3C76_1754260 [compost metagenome]
MLHYCFHNKSFLGDIYLSIVNIQGGNRISCTRRYISQSTIITRRKWDIFLATAGIPCWYISANGQRDIII